MEAQNKVTFKNLIDWLNNSLIKMVEIKELFSDLRGHIRGSVNYESIPKNQVYKRKKGAKKKSEIDSITEEMLKENNISVDAITGGTVKSGVSGEGNTIEWEDFNIKSLVREAELSEAEKKEILDIKNSKGQRLFNESFLMVAKKIKTEWAKGNGRPTIVKNLKGIQGASDGNVGKCVAAFNRVRERIKSGGDSN